MTAHVSTRALTRGATKLRTPLRGLIDVRAETNLSDPVKALEAINRGFEEFKASHAEELKGIAKKFDDVITKDRLTKIDAFMATAQETIDKQAAEIAALKANGTSTGDETTETEAQRKYRKDFEAWVKTGDGEQAIKAAMRSPEIMADASVGTNGDGGFTVPIEWDRSITRRRVSISPMRRYASVQGVNGQGFTRLFTTAGAASGWVGEVAARTKTDTPTLASYAYAFGEIYANPAASQRILEDSEMNFDTWLSDEVNTEFARQEGIAFVDGDGVNKPKGLLRYTATAEAALAAALRHPLGPIVTVNTGAASVISTDDILEVIYDLPEDRSEGAMMFANRKTWARLRKLKDSEGRYLWQPPVEAGQPASIFGQPAVGMTGLPDVEDGVIPILYGNMAETYRIFDRRGSTLLRDPYTNKPFVMFYTTQRVGGGLWNPEYMRYLRVLPAA
jgi:HK97 family phage major capsid protein